MSFANMYRTFGRQLLHKISTRGLLHNPWSRARPVASWTTFWANQLELQDGKGIDTLPTWKEEVVVVSTSNTKVHVFWDIDNKTAIWTRPEDLAANIQAALADIGEIAGVCAYGNRHTFSWVPPVEQARRKELKKRWTQESAVEKLCCTICGAKARTPKKLAAHFRVLHVREMMKRKAHPRSFQRWKAAHPESLDRYHELQDALIPPQKGYGLRRALLRSGILVNVVADKPQAADEALKADVRDLLKHLRLASAQLAKKQPAGSVGVKEDLEVEASAADGDHKWPLEYFLERLEDTECSAQGSCIERTSVEDNDSQAAHDKHVVCIISNDRGFDKLLDECKRAGCRTVAMSDLTRSSYKHADVLLSWRMAERGMY